MRSSPLRRDKPLGRRAQLRSRAKALKRSGALGQSSSLNRSRTPDRLVRKALKRTKGIEKQSKATAKFMGQERVPFVRVSLIKYPICELQNADLPDPPECWNRSGVVHETWTKKRQSVKPSDQYLVPIRAAADADQAEQDRVFAENRRQFLTLCDRCHDWIHLHPKFAGETRIWREGVSIKLLRRSLDDN